jgi:hypothetical protein
LQRDDAFTADKTKRPARASFLVQVALTFPPPGGGVLRDAMLAQQTGGAQPPGWASLPRNFRPLSRPSGPTTRQSPHVAPKSSKTGKMFRLTP